MFLTKCFIFVIFGFVLLEHFIAKAAHFDGTASSSLSDSTNCSNCKRTDILRSQHLCPVPYFLEIHYIVRNAVIESIADLMLYWKRYKGVFILDSDFGLKVSVLKKYFAEFEILIDVHLMKSTLHLKDLIREIAKNRSNIVVICNQSYTTSILNVAVELNLFSRTISWIVVGTTIPDPLLRIEIKHNSQVTLVVPVPTEFGTEEVHFLDVFFGHDTNQTESVRFACWTIARQLSILEFLDHKDRVHGLLSRTSSAVAFAHPPFSVVSYDKNGTLQTTGYVLDLVSAVMQSLNMKYTIREIEPVFGIAVNGTYTGFLGMLHRKEADFSINMLAMIYSRAGAVRYVGPYVKGYMGIFYNRPDPFMPPTAYFFPFSFRVWILTLATCIILIASVAVAWFMSRIYLNGQRWSRGAFTKLVSGDFIVEVIDDPRGFLTKIIYATLLITAILLFNHYTSVFTSFLTHREVDLPFVDLEGVVSNSEYKVLLVRDTRYEVLMGTATSGVYSDIWKKVLRAGGRDWFPTTFHEGYAMMTTRNYALITDGSSGMYMAYDNCSVAVTSKIYNKEFYFLTTRHDFPFSSFIRLAMLRAMEGGIYARLSRKYKLEGRPPCSTTTTSATFGLDQVVGVFFVWGFGLLLSVFSLFLEMTILRKYAK